MKEEAQEEEGGPVTRAGGRAGRKAPGSPEKEEVVEVGVTSPVERGVVVYNQEYHCICGKRSVRLNHVTQCKSSMVHWALETVLREDYVKARRRVILGSKGGPVPVVKEDFPAFERLEPLPVVLYRAYEEFFPKPGAGTEKEALKKAKLAVEQEERRFWKGMVTHRALVECVLRQYPESSFPELLLPVKPTKVYGDMPGVEVVKLTPGWKPRDWYVVLAVTAAHNRANKVLDVTKPGALRAGGNDRGLVQRLGAGEPVASKVLLWMCHVKEAAVGEAIWFPVSKEEVEGFNWNSEKVKEAEKVRKEALEWKRKCEEMEGRPDRTKEVAAAPSPGALPPAAENDSGLGYGSTSEEEEKKAEAVKTPVRKRKSTGSGGASAKKPKK